MGVVIRLGDLLHALFGFLLLLEQVEPHLASSEKRRHHFIRNQFRILFKVSHHARLDEFFRLGSGTAELFETGMDLIPHLDPQLLNALVLVLKELQRLLR